MVYRWFVLTQITPIVLTYNEAPNIRRTLDVLRWARDIVVVDSFSDDATVSLAQKFPQVRVVQRRFDSLENQCNFALRQIPLSTEWVLALDADYVLTPELVEELRTLNPNDSFNGLRAQFIYCIEGKRLRGSAYPPVTVLYRHKSAFYRQDGHAHRVVVDGEVRDLKAFILHDDRKPLSRWLRSQDTYMQQELVKLREASGVRREGALEQRARGREQGAAQIVRREASGVRSKATKNCGSRMSAFGFEDKQGAIREERSGKGEANDFEFRNSDCEFKEPERSSAGLGLADRLRRTRFLFPFVIFFYCLFVKGGIRDGWAGVYYAFQRMLAETLLALYLIEDELKAEVSGQMSEVGEQHVAGGMELGAGVGPEIRDQRLEVSEDFVRSKS